MTRFSSTMARSVERAGGGGASAAASIHRQPARWMGEASSTLPRAKPPLLHQLVGWMTRFSSTMARSVERAGGGGASAAASIHRQPARWMGEASSTLPRAKPPLLHQLVGWMTRFSSTMARSVERAGEGGASAPAFIHRQPARWMGEASSTLRRAKPPSLHQPVGWMTLFSSTMALLGGASRWRWRECRCVHPSPTRKGGWVKRHPPYPEPSRRCCISS